ncbi:hypothetical protein D9619_011960 [Psilocybe cf. subviscida]|uniref:NACHT domain-containing protein n=1 Tax=Psilocybe cf. subviscida TaxID=2480587 RepID=A0A8H5EVZ7_9AGAR|nr:hypothetical protein D9619_011960 [Psilocybe cf. subviscida]
MSQSTSGDSGPRNVDSGVSMFRDASNMNFHNSTLITNGSGGTNKKKRIANAMALLGSRAEKGSPYDAAAREDVPKCQEHTRVAIIGGIHKWAHSQEPDAPPLMWMYGPAGSGKTTIMQTVAETFDKEGSLAMSFFFSRLSAKRPKEKENFVITMAHQLALFIPALQQPLAGALSDSSILTKSLTKQLDSLIVGPLKTLDAAQVGSRCIFLVDGLDECDGDTAQRDVLDLLERLLDQAHHHVRVLVASRSLSHIQSFFSQRRIGERTQSTPLDNDYQSDKDIRQYFISKFGKISQEHPARSGLPSEWPSDSDVKVLEKRASGQFIYASVVMKFIGDHSRHPDESLQMIINLKSSSDARPYEELDAVYAQVLSTIEPHNLEFVQTLIGCLLLGVREGAFSQVAHNQATTVIDSVFMIQPGTTDARINRIYPLIDIADDGRMSLSHASFPEYLRDCSRSKKFWIDMRKLRCTLARLWFKSYDAHFRVFPYEDSIPSGIAGHQHRLIERLSTLPEAPDMDVTFLHDMISHCLGAEWTSELRQDILAFDVQAAFSFIGPQSRWSKYDGSEEIHWPRTVLWLSFVIWIDQHDLLSAADTGYLRDRIQSYLSALHLSAADRRTIAAVLTWRDHADIWSLWDKTCSHKRSLQQHSCLMEIFSHHPTILQDTNIQDASRIWLCQALVPDMAMNGSFFSSEDLYADLILQYIRNSLIAPPPLGEYSSRYRDFDIDVLMMLCKASPSNELATCLLQLVIQTDGKFLREHHIRKEHFIAVCIYLFECGVPYISEHWHRPEFDAYDNWLCGICVLFDPFKECTGIELSRDPPVKPDAVPAQIIEGQVPQPLQIDQARQFIPGIPPLWLRTWIFWLADIVIRFFPVVA